MITPAVGQYYENRMMNGKDWGWGAAMMFFWLIALFVIAICVVYFFKNHKHQEPDDSSALEFAQKRYVKGEITKSEFEQLKKDIAL